MGKQKFLSAGLTALFLFTLTFSSAEAFYHSPIPNIKNIVKQQLLTQLEMMCQRQAVIHNHFPKFFRMPKICKKLDIVKSPTLDFYTDNPIINAGDRVNLQWAADNVVSCEAGGGWTGTKDLSGEEIVYPTETTEYFLTCQGAAEEVTQSVMVEVVPVLEPSLDHLIISEVYYDVDDLHGDETNEWLEIYNGTGADIDISGWVIEDNTSQDLIPGGTVVPNGGFIILTGSDTTSGFWGNVPMVNMGGSIGNGLAGNDVILLKNLEATVMDAVSYGTNTEAFDPPVPSVIEGHSIYRSDLKIDTNTAADWSDSDTPKPGT